MQLRLKRILVVASKRRILCADGVAAELIRERAAGVTLTNLEMISKQLLL